MFVVRIIIILLSILYFTSLGGYAQCSVSVGNDITLDCTTTLATLTGVATGASPFTYQWSPSAGLDDPTSATPTATPTTTTTYTLQITASDGCTSTDDITITVDNSTPNVNVGNDATIDCVNLSASLDGSNSDNGTYLWTPSTGLDDPTSPTPTATPTSTITYTLQVTASNGCTDTDDVTVTVNVSTPNADAGNDITINCTTPTAVLDGSNSDNGTYLWTPATGLDDPTSATPTVSVPAGTNTTYTTTYTLQVTGSNGCVATDAMQLTVDMTPPTADAGPDLGTTCANLNAQLNASGGVSYSWSPTYALSDPNIANPIATPAQPMVYTVTVTGANGCTATDNVSVVINDVTPSAQAGVDIELCGVYSTSLHADGSGNLPSDIKMWSVDLTYPLGPNPSNLILSDPYDPNAMLTGLQEGTYRLFWTVSNNVCPPITDTLFVKVYDPPQNQVGQGTAGIDDSICGATEVDLNANVPIGTATGKWDLNATFPNPTTNLTFSDSTAPNCHVSNLVEGVYSFIWIVSNGTCPSAEDTVLINIYNTPVADAGTDIDLCNVFSTTLNGNTPAGTATGIWAEELNFVSPSTVSFDDATFPNTTVSNLVEGTYHLVWTVSNGNCPKAMDTVFVNAFNPPIADAGLDASVCGIDTLYFDTLYFLNAGQPAGTSTGKWTLDVAFNNTTSTVEIINDTSYNNAGVTHLLEGEYQFVWTVSNGTCQDATDVMHVYTFDKPFSNAGQDQELCATYTVDMTALPTIGTSTGMWSNANGNPTTITFSDATSPTTSTSGYIEGEYFLIWTVSNDNCNPVNDTVKITIYDQPVADAGADFGICATSTAVLDAVPPVGTAHGYWREDLNFGNLTTIHFLDSSVYNTQSSGYIEGTYQLIWIVSNGVCSDSLDTLQITMSNLPIADAGADQYLCQLDTVQLHGVGEIGTAHGHWEYNSTSPSVPLFRDATDSATWVDDLVVGNYDMIWIVENGVCPADTDTVVIINQERPVAMAEYPSLTCDNECFDLISLSTTPTGTTLLLDWEINNTSYTDSVQQICLTEVGTFPLRLIVEASNGCKDSLIGNLNITVQPSPIAGFEMIFEGDSLIEIEPMHIVNLSSNDVTDIVYSMGTGDTINKHEFIYYYENYGLYDVTQWVENQYGCRDSVTLGQPVAKRRTIFVPNTFTPNKDGINDEFAPITWAFSPEFYEFTIYDQWGAMIFRTTSMDMKWDGTYKGEIVKDGAYIWQLRYMFANSNEILFEKGHVNVYK